MPTTISPNMNLVVPTVGQQPGPDWANDINASLSIVDGHDHTSGKGVAITPNGLNINADLPFNSNDATLLRSARFSVNNSPLAAVSPDIGCVYVSGADLYYNDGNGNQIRITQAGAVSGAAGTITGLPSGTASASFSAIQGTFTFEQATATGANIDAGTLIIRYPGAYPVPAGNFISLQAPAALATGYAFTLPTNVPVSNNSILISSTTGVISYASADNATLEISGGVFQVKALGIQQSNIYKRTTGLTVGAGNVALQDNFSAITNVLFPYVPAGNALTLTTTGRPLIIQIGGGVLSAGSYLGAFNNLPVGIYVYVDGGQVFSTYMGTAGGTYYYPVTTFLYKLLPAGVHTFQLYINASAGGQITLQEISLIVYEI